MIKIEILIDDHILAVPIIKVNWVFPLFFDLFPNPVQTPGYPRHKKKNSRDRAREFLMDYCACSFFLFQRPNLDDVFYLGNTFHGFIRDFAGDINDIVCQVTFALVDHFNDVQAGFAEHG